jgi:hypothetical protein
MASEAAGNPTVADDQCVTAGQAGKVDSRTPRSNRSALTPGAHCTDNPPAPELCAERLQQFTYCCERYSLAGAGCLRSERVPRGHKSA